jgi:hypothetical protein
MEDDYNMSSTFFCDLQNLLQNTNNIPITIAYHSEKYYGSQLFKIKKDTFSAYKIPKVKHYHYHDLKRALEDFFKDYYKKGKKNIFYFGGHSNMLYYDANNIKTNLFYALYTKVFESFSGLELLILDSCYTSYTNMLSTLIGKTNYVMACSTSSPNLGFISKDMLDLLNNKKFNKVDRYKKIIDSYLRRADDKNYAQFDFRTDGALIDMKKYVHVHIFLKDNPINKKEKCRVEFIEDYSYYDLYCLAKNKKFKQLIKDCILHFKMNSLAKNHFNKQKLRLHGLIIGLLPDKYNLVKNN